MRVGRWRCRATCSAGARPNRSGRAKAMPIANANTRQSGVGSSHAGAPVADHQAAQSDMAHADPGGRSQESQQQAFSEQLANQPRAAGADGDADRDLPVARDAPRQQQAAEVAAGHGEDQQDQRADQREHRVDLAGRWGARSACRATAHLARSRQARWPDVRSPRCRRDAARAASPAAPAVSSSAIGGVTPGRIRPHILTPPLSAEKSVSSWLPLTKYGCAARCGSHTSGLIEARARRTPATRRRSRRAACPLRRIVVRRPTGRRRSAAARSRDSGRPPASASAPSSMAGRAGGRAVGCAPSSLKKFAVTKCALMGRLFALDGQPRAVDREDGRQCASRGSRIERHLRVGQVGRVHDPGARRSNRSSVSGSRTGSGRSATVEEAERRDVDADADAEHQRRRRAVKPGDRRSMRAA